MKDSILIFVFTAINVLYLFFVVGSLVYFTMWSDKSFKEDKQKSTFLECQQKTQDIEWCYSKFLNK